jgi:uncharacterized protein
MYGKPNPFNTFKIDRNMKAAIIYHQAKVGVDCPDGIAAAWVAKRKYPDAALIGASYGGVVPDIDRSEYDRILIVDFSFSREILEKWAKNFELLVIDHHKTAMADLQDFPNAVFDMEECGATLTWKTLFPEEPLPAVFDYVKDRDLWNFVLPDSEEIHEAMSFIGRKSYQFDFLCGLSQEDLRSLFAPLGSRLLAPKRKRIAEIATTARDTSVLGHDAMIVNVDDGESRLISDICSAIYKAHPEKDFVVAQSCKPADLTWALSFRSDKNGNDFDVSEIARQFGGGGHRNAAGGKSDRALP